ncbi:Speckle-type POZ protein A [Aphelenchoides bicaudatus]|nr:Speckle-type POZ protein A [Aphelenchoides bicaudatus]
MNQDDCSLPYPPEVGKKLFSFYKEGITGDCTIIVCDQMFKVSKMILMINSEPFEKMFTGNMVESRTGVVEVNDCRPEVFKAFIAYLHLHDFQGLDSMAEELLFLADKYMVKSLKKDCVSSLIKSTNDSNIVDRICMVSTFNIEELKKHLLKSVNCRPEVFEAFVEYLHSHSIEGLEPMAGELLVLASKYMINNLEEDCISVLIKSADDSNIVGRLFLAFMLNIEKFKKELLKFATDRYKGGFSRITSSDKWKQRMKKETKLAIEILKAFLVNKHFKQSFLLFQKQIIFLHVQSLSSAYSKSPSRKKSVATATSNGLKMMDNQHENEEQLVHKRVELLQQELNKAHNKVADLEERNKSLTENLGAKEIELNIAQQDREKRFKADLTQKVPKLNVFPIVLLVLIALNALLLSSFLIHKQSINLADQNAMLRGENAALIDQNAMLKNENDELRHKLQRLRMRLINEPSTQLIVFSSRADFFIYILETQARLKFYSKEYNDALKLFLKAINVMEKQKVNATKNADLKLQRESEDQLAGLWTTAAACWFFMDRYDKALQAVEKAIELDPTDAYLFFFRGIYHSKMGSRSEAISDLKRALILDPDHKLATSFLHTLESINYTPKNIYLFLLLLHMLTSMFGKVECILFNS